MDQIQEKNSIHFVYTWAYYTHSSGKSAQRDFLESGAENEKVVAYVKMKSPIFYPNLLPPWKRGH